MQREGMVDIFDRLGNFIRTILDEEAVGVGPDSFTDPDQSAAWEELEQYMEDGKSEPKPDFSSSTSAARQEASALIRKDFRNLELTPGAPMEEVQKNYKKLLTAFHPDRHASNPEKFRTATEVTKKLNESYQRIRSWYGEGS